MTKTKKRFFTGIHKESKWMPFKEQECPNCGSFCEHPTVIEKNTKTLYIYCAECKIMTKLED
jgi:Pyruvate/2-oxoacid:ferredoxin oxidoreductase delta subunit